MAPRRSPETAAAAAEEMDPDYAFFLSHLHPSGTSYVFQHDDIRIKHEEAATPKKEKKKLKKKERGETEDDSVRSEVLKAAAGPSSMDEDYVHFLNHVRRMPDGSLVYKLDNGVIVQYEKDEEEAPEQQQEEETQVSPCSSTGQNQINVPAPEYSSNRKSSRHHSLERLTTEYSPFKKRLMKALEGPFNQGEYDKLLKSANDRKPMKRRRVLRRDDISYESKTMGLSYFEQHPVLARKVERADHVRGLNLLRGFFFWLENLELEGSYMPWVSKPSPRRTIMPSSSESLA